MLKSTMLSCTIGLAAVLAVQGKAESPSGAYQISRNAPLILGVQTHFGENASNAGYDVSRTVQALRSLHATSIRDSIAWPHFVGAGPDQIQQGSASIFAVMSALNSSSPPMLTLTGVPESEDGGHLPSSPAALSALATFSGKAAAAASRRPALIEFWNEWDRGNYRDKAGDPRAYVAALQSASSAIRKADPSAQIIAGAAADNRGPDPLAWTKSMIDAGGLRYADGLSVHMYDHCNSRQVARGADEMMDRIDAIHAYAAKAAPRSSSIYVSEFGWPTAAGAKCQVTPEVAAENTAQFIIQASTRPWLKGVWYYELKDEAAGSQDVEKNFGLTDASYQPKSSFCGYQEAARLVEKGRPTSVTRQDNAMRVDFDTPSGKLSVIWLTDRAGVMSYKTDAGVTVDPVCGDPSQSTGAWAPLTARLLLLRGADAGALPSVTFRRD